MTRVGINRARVRCRVQDSQAIVNFIINYIISHSLHGTSLWSLLCLGQKKAHYDYLTLVWFIGIDKSQIIEIVEKLHLLLGTKPVATFSRGHQHYTRDRYAENNSAFKCG